MTSFLGCCSWPKDSDMDMVGEEISVVQLILGFGHDSVKKGGGHYPLPVLRMGFFTQTLLVARSQRLLLPSPSVVR